MRAEGDDTVEKGKQKRDLVKQILEGDITPASGRGMRPPRDEVFARLGVRSVTTVSYDA
jgi:hypothetical protein